MHDHTTVALLAWLALASAPAAAHPASGIAVDDGGRVFFADTRDGILRIDAPGKLTRISPEGLHWMTMDREGRFAASPEEFGPFARRTPRGEKPVLLAGASPCAAGADGTVYYAKDHALTIGRCSPDGRDSILVTKERFVRDWTHNMGVTGMACGPDGTVYVVGLDSFNKNEGVGEHVIWAVKPDGTVGKFAEGFVKEKDRLPPADRHPEVGPTFCRGIAVDKDGAVYVAVTGNRCVMKLTPHGPATIIHRTTRPWIPTGVDVFRGDLYVLEYDDETPAKHGDWPPRVKKVSRDGKVSTLATVTRTTGSQ